MRTHEHKLPRLMTGAMMLIAALLSVACDGDSHHNYSNVTGPDAIIGSGRVVSESRSVGGFHGVSMSGAGRLLIDRNGFESLTITADDNILPLLTSDVVGGLLELRVSTGSSIRTASEITYEVAARRLDHIRLSGAGDIEAMGIDTSNFRLDVSGAANVTAFGRADQQDVSISGAGRYDAERVESRAVTIAVSGAAFARLRVSGELTATVSGAGVIEYYGDPVVHVSGNGTVRRMGP